ncbi:unnamed protein product [Laminaria digitata]
MKTSLSGHTKPKIDNLFYYGILVPFSGKICPSVRPSVLMQKYLKTVHRWILRQFTVSKMKSALDGTHNPSQTPFPFWAYLVLAAPPNLGRLFVNTGVFSY